MVQSYKILRRNGDEIVVEFSDGENTFKTKHILPIKEDASPYSEQEIEDFLVENWPHRNLASKKNSAFAFAAVDGLMNNTRDVTNKISGKVR